MLGFMVPVILSLAATARAYREVASEAQIRFALENKYDDTGPGALQPQFAYNTYGTLDDALIAYLDDPDTNLPEHERNRAVQRLVQPSYGQYEHEVKRYYPKTVEEYTGYNKPKQNLVLTKLNAPKKYAVPVYGFQGPLLKEREHEAEPYKVKRIKPSRGNPVSVDHYSRDPEQDQYNTNPKYTYSYGVNVPDTGDHKSAQESREGGAVRGYYSFLDADGAQRTVHYTADDHLGFQATVERIQHHY